MAGLTYSRKAPCVGVFVPYDPITCQPLPDSFVFKFRGDTPIESAVEYSDDQDWTETASDGSKCGPAIAQRGTPVRSEITISRCQISVDMDTALRGSNGRLLAAGGDTVGSVETYSPSTSLCSQTPLPAGLLLAVTPIAECGTSGYCTDAGDNCMLEGWPWVIEPRVTDRSLQSQSDPASFSVWAYPMPADVIPSIPANITALVPGGFAEGDFRFSVRIPCSLVPTASCDTVPTADLFAA